ncbi:hypothetical protein [Streptomyces sp. TLI_185]|uniref:hypothetical protein n=1 Tax=Streptomyces sp. TLI_185 TaxID=2485151 RepID=UPI0021A3B6DC|nr:hypothetical protein [Streptomyces sp. TLI_185]
MSWQEPLEIVSHARVPSFMRYASVPPPQVTTTVPCTRVTLGVSWTSPPVAMPWPSPSSDTGKSPSQISRPSSRSKKATWLQKALPRSLARNSTAVRLSPVTCRV